jgi:phytoene dehydrogenase-like protein
VPWLAKECARAATVHVGGSFAEIAASERAAFRGEVCERPFILFVQPTVSDPSRAPAGKHIGWAYCHVPNGCAVDMTERMEAQIERFAPGFRSTILARSVLSPAALEQGNANLVGGDISGGVQDWRQLLIRPTRSRYRTPLSNVYLCSSSTPPGGGVHGMCGYHAVRAALKDRGTPVAGWGWR